MRKKYESFTVDTRDELERIIGVLQSVLAFPYLNDSNRNREISVKNPNRQNIIIILLLLLKLNSMEESNALTYFYRKYKQIIENDNNINGLTTITIRTTTTNKELEGVILP